MNEEKIVNGSIYILSNHHRNLQNGHKSKWLIGKTDELNCFELMLIENWINTDEGWSLHRINNDNHILGKNSVRNNLRLAKFDCDHNSKWHGYPLDYLGNKKRNPTKKVLKKWVSLGIISKREMEKINKGQEGCEL